MKKIILPLSMALAVGIFAGCRQEEPVSANPDTNSVGSETTNAMSSMASGASNAWQNTKEASSNAWDATKSTATNAWQATKDATTNAWQHTKDAFNSGMSTNEVSTNYFGYDYSMKDKFVTEVQASLADLDDRASKLSARMATASDSTKTDLQQTLQDLKDKRAELDKKYDDIKNSSQDNWNDAKAAFTKSYYDVKADLKAGWDTMASKL